MLNPNTDKFSIAFDSKFFNNDIAKKYNDYLFHLNGPIKNIQDHIEESIQSLSIPGFELEVLQVNGLSNLKGTVFQSLGSKPINFPNTSSTRQYAGTAADNVVLESQSVGITFRNTLLNWMYLYEYSQNYYKRSRSVFEFGIIITLHDAAEIPLMNFVFQDSFISGMPGLEFAFNQAFREAKTIDTKFTFNGMTTNFMIPEFGLSKLIL